MSNNEEYSKGGSQIHRYENDKKELVFALTDGNSAEKVAAHIEKYVGNPKTVWHELVSPFVHIDVHIVEPTEQRDFYTLVTSGMSDKPMNAPFEECKFAEIMICLPSDWNINEDDFKNSQNFWTLSWLKQLARLPHQYNTWFWESHTIPNGDPPQPYANNTQLCGALLSSPVLFGNEFCKLKINEDKIINFLSFIPIYKEEMQYKLDNGIDALYDRFDKFGVSELLSVTRINSCLI